MFKSESSELFIHQTVLVHCHRSFPKLMNIRYFTKIWFRMANSELDVSNSIRIMYATLEEESIKHCPLNKDLNPNKNIDCNPLILTQLPFFEELDPKSNIVYIPQIQTSLFNDWTPRSESKLSQY